MVAVHRTSVPAPKAWTDLAGGGYATLAVPDPAVAASALGALGWFAAEPGYGTGFYRALKSRGAVQVGTPDEVYEYRITLSEDEIEQWRLETLADLQSGRLTVEASQDHEVGGIFFVATDMGIFSDMETNIQVVHHSRPKIMGGNRARYPISSPLHQTHGGDQR